MKISRERISGILQFYLQDMKLEDKIMDCILEECEDCARKGSDENE